MTTRPEDPFITSVAVQQGPAHDYVSIWIRHACVGTLCLGKGDGEDLRQRLLAGETSMQTAELTPWMQGSLRVMREPDGSSRCPPDLQPDERTLELARGQGFDDAAIAREVQSFADYQHAQGQTRFDWQSLLRSWFRRRRAHLDDLQRAQPPVDPELMDRARTVGVSRPAPAREPPAAGTPPTFDEDAWRDEETIG